MKSPISKEEDANVAEEIVSRDKRFCNSVKFCLFALSPLVEVLKLVDGDGKPATGHIYEAMARAKEQRAGNYRY